MIRPSIRQLLLSGFVLLVLGVVPPNAAGQLLTQHVKGAVGRKAGSQPPPGGYVVLPILYVYNSATQGSAVLIQATFLTTRTRFSTLRVTLRSPLLRVEIRDLDDLSNLDLSNLDLSNLDLSNLTHHQPLQSLL